MFPRVLRQAFDADALALWVVGSVTWGAVAFILGWAWMRMIGRTSNLKAQEKTLPQGGSAFEGQSHTSSNYEQMEQTGAQEPDDSTYEKIATELEGEARKEGLWTRLYAENGGDETQTRVAYIKSRARQLLAEGMQQVRSTPHEAPNSQSTLPALPSAAEPPVADSDLVAAVWGGSYNTAGTLLAAGRSPQGVDAAGRTLIDLARLRNDREMINLLKCYGATVAGAGKQ